MKRSTILLAMNLLAGCMAHIPTAAPIHDDRQALVKETVNLGNQTVYKDEPLTHYRIEGVDAYCTGLVSMDLSLYRCFALEGDKLTKGLNAQKNEWEPLRTPILITVR